MDAQLQAGFLVGSSVVKKVEKKTATKAIPIDLHDAAKLKQILDESVCMFLCDSLTFREDESLVNLKLFLMTVACAFALFAQLGGIPFPSGRWLLAGCCGLYFVVSGVLQAIATFVEKDILMETRRGDDGGLPYVRVRTAMGRFEDRWTLILEADPRVYGKGGAGNVKYEKSLYVGDCFYSDGTFAEAPFADAAEEAVRAFVLLLKDRHEKLNLSTPKCPVVPERVPKDMIASSEGQAKGKGDEQKKND